MWCLLSQQLLLCLCLITLSISFLFVAMQLSLGKPLEKVLTSEMCKKLKEKADSGVKLPRHRIAFMLACSDAFADQQNKKKSS